jgi:hypothetical protein
MPRVAENNEVDGNGLKCNMDAQVGMNVFSDGGIAEALMEPHGTGTWDAKTPLRHTDLLAGWQPSRPTIG